MIVVLLPAYNESESLQKLMQKLQKVLIELGEEYKIIVCNDGSTDSTQEILEYLATTMPIEIIQHKINRGLGESSRDLFERSCEITQPGDVIVRLDCDDTHEPQYIPSIIEKVRSGYDVVIASRFVSGGGQLGVSAYRALISRSANLFMKFFFRIEGLREYSCGFRGYNALKIQESIAFFGNNFIQLKGLGFTCTLEKLVKLKLIGASFGEVPFLLRYDQKQSASKMVSSITTLGYLVMTLLYHWPWGGWKAAIRDRHSNWRFANDQH
ncbi:MAG: glycosyltransferase family 2 protein [Negativicutes bacterium]|nr:glycosyltransferase family 2 protein [Negativicutes bacterium]